MDMALPGCIGALMHSGQGCALATRMLVPRSHYDQAVEVASATFGALAVGDPSDPNTFCGPLVSAKQRDRVLNYIEIAKRDGGRVTAGGGVPEGLDRGYFVAPTVVADVAPGPHDLPGGGLRSGAVHHALRRRRRRCGRDGE